MKLASPSLAVAFFNTKGPNKTWRNFLLCLQRKETLPQSFTFAKLCCICRVIFCFISFLFVANKFFSLSDLDFSFLKRAAADCAS